MLLSVAVFAAKSSLSQVSIEVIGRDTFPTETTYHGVPVSVWTNSQTGQIAHAFERVKFLDQSFNAVQATNTQLGKIIEQKNIDLAAKKYIIDSVSMQLSESSKNERDLKTALAAAKDKAFAIKSKYVLKMATSIPIAFLAGSVAGTLFGFYGVKKK